MGTAIVCAHASRFIATPSAETMPEGRYSVWQFGVYEQKGNKHWRTMNRLDLGAGGGVELGIFSISSHGQQPDTWVNAQWQPMPETDRLPSFSVGIWDLLRKSPMFSSRTIGLSPFFSFGKTIKQGARFAKFGLNLGANRLDGLSGGLDLRFLKGTGAMLEFVSKNMRLKGTDAWNAAIYQWFGPYFRVRATRAGGDPMIDGFFIWTFSGK
jgi:hypothetical protein